MPGRKFQEAQVAAQMGGEVLLTDDLRHKLRLAKSKTSGSPSFKSPAPFRSLFKMHVYVPLYVMSIYRYIST